MSSFTFSRDTIGGPLVGGIATRRVREAARRQPPARHHAAGGDRDVRGGDLALDGQGDERPPAHAHGARQRAARRVGAQPALHVRRRWKQRTRRGRPPRGAGERHRAGRGTPAGPHQAPAALLPLPRARRSQPRRQPLSLHHRRRPLREPRPRRVAAARLREDLLLRRQRRQARRRPGRRDRAGPQRARRRGRDRPDEHQARRATATPRTAARSAPSSTRARSSAGSSTPPRC